MEQKQICPRCQLEREAGLEDDGGSACPDCQRLRKNVENIQDISWIRPTQTEGPSS